MRMLRRFRRISILCIALVLLIVTSEPELSFSQGSRLPSQTLPSNRVLERELSGATAHRYKLALQKDEFFQVRVEQKGIDVVLKLLTASGEIIATMDSPNESEGAETLTYVADKAGAFVLEVVQSGENAGMGRYTIKRSAPRAATAQDRLRVETERLFVEGMAARDAEGQTQVALKKLTAALRGWKELQDDYMIEMTARQLAALQLTQLKHDIRPLQVGEPVERQLGKQEVHFYPVELKQGQVLRLNVETAGVSVVLGFGLAEGQQVQGVSAFGFSYGRETLTYVVEQSGRYIVGISPARKSYGQGSYILSAEVKAEADESDRERMSAERLLTEGFMLINKGNRVSVGNAAGALEASLKLWQALGEQYWEAFTLNLLGVAQMRSGKTAEAIATTARAMTLWKPLHDKPGEAFALSNLGVIYLEQRENRKAVKALKGAVNLAREVGDQESEASYLMTLSAAFAELGEREKGLACWFASIGRVGSQDMASMLSEVGMAKKEFGDFRAAKEILEKSLEYAMSDGNPYTEARALRNLSGIYLQLGHKAEALELANISADRFREVGNVEGLAFAMGYLSEISLAMGDREAAFEYASKALSLAGDKKYTKIFLWAGEAYTAMGQPTVGSYFLRKTLLFAKRSVDYADEARALRGLMEAWRKLGNPRLAIFYGKQAVNVLQSQRSWLKSVDQLDNTPQPGDTSGVKLADPDEEDNPETKSGLVSIHREYGSRSGQKLFLKSYEEVYKQLAELLIHEHRLEEAQEVLIALNDQQALDFDPADKTEPAPLSATPREAAAAERYEQAGAQLKEIKFRLHRWMEESEEDTFSIKAIPKNGSGMSEEDELKEDKVTISRLDSSMGRFGGIIKEIDQDFKQGASDKDKFLGSGVVRDLQQTLSLIAAKTNQKTVAIYQIFSEGAFHTMLVTPDAVSCITSKASAAEINNKALQLWALLQNDSYDPALLSNDLYNLIFKPVEDWLPEDTGTILWSLDGNLRYVPMAALYDGRQYLVERYNHVLFTRMDRGRVMRDVKPIWTGYGFASSKAHKLEFLDKTVEFKPLDFTKDEMQIFRTKTSPQGIIPGDVLSEGDFNKGSFITKLRQSRPLVHISSHFSFYPGNEYRSFLLLGDGSLMTLSDFKKQPDLFKGVDLLTLSACDTAAQLPGADGREIDGFAELAQHLGASSVLASLWQVDDASTALLMRDFYRNRQSGGLNKAEALRRSQLGLLNGTINARAFLASNRARASANRGSPSIKEIFVEPKYRIPFVGDALRKPFAHPYFWSPFVLFGNWR